MSSWRANIMSMHSEPMGKTRKCHEYLGRELSRQDREMS